MSPLPVRKQHEILAFMSANWEILLSFTTATGFIFGM